MKYIFYTLFVIIGLALIGLLAYIAYLMASSEDGTSPNTNSNAVIEHEIVVPSVVNVNEPVVKNTNTAVEEVEVVDLEAEGKIKNDDYHYIIDVGKEHVGKMTQIKSDQLEGITDTYVYCYETVAEDYGGLYCDSNEVGIFNINIYSEAEWQEALTYPFVGTLMGQDAGYYFALSHPNGLMPEDVPANEDYYDSVITSIDFAD